MKLTAVFKVIVSFAIIFTVVGFFYSATHGEIKPPETDRYGCLSGQAPQGSTLVLIDRTDAYSAGQVQACRKELGRIHDAVKSGDLVTVASIGGELPAVINFRACSPEKGETPSLLKSFQRNVDWAQQQSEYEKTFQLPMQKLADELPLNQTTAHSPIIQSIAGLMEQLGAHWGRAVKRSLTLISDGMENTETFSHYDKDSNRKSFAEVRRGIPYIRDTPLDLRGVSVTVLYLTGFPHNQDLQGMEHQRFWRDLVAFYGGDLVDWIVVSAADGVSQ